MGRAKRARGSNDRCMLKEVGVGKQQELQWMEDMRVERWDYMRGHEEYRWMATELLWEMYNICRCFLYSPIPAEDAIHPNGACSIPRIFP